MPGQFFGRYALTDTPNPRIWVYVPDPTDPFGYTTAAGLTVRLTESFETDLATVPKPFWSFGFDPWGFVRAALVHDWLWELDARGRRLLGFRDSNVLLREACRTLGLPEWKCRCIYWACELFGGYLWLKH